MRFKSSNSKSRNKKKTVFFIGIFGLVFFLFLMTKTLVTELFFNFWYFIGLILMLILIIKNRTWKLNDKEVMNLIGISVQELPFNIQVQNHDDNEFSRFTYRNKSKYIVTQFIIEGILINTGKILGYKNTSTVFPGNESTVMIKDYPDDFKIEKIKYEYLDKQNDNISIEYDCKTKQHKILSEDKVFNKRKIGFFSKFAIIYLGLFLIGFLLIGLGILKVGDSVYTDNNLPQTSYSEKSKQFSVPDVTADQFQFVNTEEYDWEYYVDSINNCWGVFRIQNNSSYPLTSVKYTIVEKKTGKRCYLNFNDTILPGEKSAEDKTILGRNVEHSFVPEIDFLEISYTYKNSMDQYVSIKYDVKLNEYKYGF